MREHDSIRYTTPYEDAMADNQTADRHDPDTIRRGSYAEHAQQFPEARLSDCCWAPILRGGPDICSRCHGHCGEATPETEDDEPCCSPFVQRLADVCGFLALAIAMSVLAYLAVTR